MKMKWRLRVLMAEREIPTATELQRRLKDVGVEISSVQLTRVIKEMPSRISAQLLRGLLEVLDCGVEDLILVERDGDATPAETLKESKKKSGNVRRISKKKPNRDSLVSGDVSELVGPKARPFPSSLDED